jgi:hypothetical protein
VNTFPSLRWMWALRDAEITPKTRELGLLMMSYADASGLMRPTVDQLRLKIVNDNDVPVSASTIKRRRKELVDAGWIELVQRGGKGRGSAYASSYRLTFPVAATRFKGAAANSSHLPSENGSRRELPSETEVTLTSVSSSDSRAKRVAAWGRSTGMANGDAVGQFGERKPPVPSAALEAPPTGFSHALHLEEDEPEAVAEGESEDGINACDDRHEEAFTAITAPLQLELDPRARLTPEEWLRRKLDVDDRRLSGEIGLGDVCRELLAASQYEVELLLELPAPRLLNVLFSHNTFAEARRKTLPSLVEAALDRRARAASDVAVAAAREEVPF